MKFMFSKLLNGMRSYLFAISLIALCLSCSKYKDKNVYNIFGDAFRTCSFEKHKNLWSGIVYFDKVNISDTSGFATFPLYLGENKFVVGTNNGHISLFEHTYLIWEKTLDSGEYVISNFVADSKKNIFFITNFFRLFSFSNSGGKNWAIKIEDTSKWVSTILATDDAMYFSTSARKLYKYSFDGNLIWIKDLPLLSTPTFARFQDGIVLNISFDQFEMTDTLIYLDRYGNYRWKFFVDKVRLLKSPVIFENNIFVFGVNTSFKKDIGVLFCINSDGKLIWKKEFAMIPRFLSVSKDKELYLVLYSVGIGQTVSELQKIDLKGNTINRQFITSTFYSPFFIGKTKLFNLGYNEGIPSIIFFGKDLVLVKTLDLSRSPVPLILPVILEDGTIIYLASDGPYLIRIDENPILKLLPW